MNNLISCRVNIMISNMDEAIEFYHGTLGLELQNRYGNHYAELRGPDILIALHPAPSNVLTGDNISVGFGVVHFDDVLHDLQSKGIEFKVAEDGWIRLAHFTDPDQNQLFLAERKDTVKN
ncbi:MAG: VOC family protein [Saprospiraceae bacterium]